MGGCAADYDEGYALRRTGDGEVREMDRSAVRGFKSLRLAGIGSSVKGNDVAFG